MISESGDDDDDYDKTTDIMPNTLFPSFSKSLLIPFGKGKGPGPARKMAIKIRSPQYNGAVAAFH